MTETCVDKSEKTVLPNIKNRCGLETRTIVSWALLFVSFFIGLITLYKGQFGDEAYNLVIGSLLLNDYVLYRDVFTHHFPFAHYWSAMVIALFGKSILILRLSVLLFQTAVFGLGMKLSGDYLLVSITAVIWSFIRSFYRGNMVLYTSFSTSSLVLIMIVMMAILRHKVSPGWKHWLIIGGFSAIAVLSDPLSIYAVGMVHVFLFTKKPVWIIKTGLVFALVLTSYAGYLAASESLQAFWNNAIVFNSQIYTRYRPVNPMPFKELLTITTDGLGITDKAFLKLNPFKSIQQHPRVFDNWLFTGFLYRFSVICCVLSLLLRKRFRTAVFLYLFVASTLIIGKGQFRAQPFVMTSLVTISAFMTYDWWQKSQNAALKFTECCLRLLIIVGSGWLCFRLAIHIVDYRDTYGDAQFAGVKTEMSRIEALSCDSSEDVFLAHYPLGGYYYWFTEMKPVSGYIYMWPWVAEIALGNVIFALEQKEIKAIAVINEGQVWGRYHTQEYLHSLIDFLERNYHKVSENIYISPSLYNQCSKQPVDSTLSPVDFHGDTDWQHL
jgi:hypothetical protein